MDTFDMKRNHLILLAAVAVAAIFSFAMDPHAALSGLSPVAAFNVDPMSLAVPAGMIGAVGAIMQKVPYTNETRNFQHVGGVTVPPGETRDVDPALLPDYKPEGESHEVEPTDPIATLLKGNVRSVIAALRDLSDEELAKAGALEQDGKKRDEILSAMMVEVLRRTDEMMQARDAAAKARAEAEAAAKAQAEAEAAVKAQAEAEAAANAQAEAEAAAKAQAEAEAAAKAQAEAEAAAKAQAEAEAAAKSKSKK
jgi:hypothetical protein